eukprot:TRINITY_DN20887_c0_g1_i1.p2 TRINITY_DN20887_c0_g1~~TRINITY_DN20887_c0_g1_i1.p2  ORF type:complete len:105 (-),score=7.11 TRINITY_DN20887_c0_g1_i1:21-335(-)
MSPAVVKNQMCVLHMHVPVGAAYTIKDGNRCGGQPGKIHTPFQMMPCKAWLCGLFAFRTVAKRGTAQQRLSHLGQDKMQLSRQLCALPTFPTDGSKAGGCAGQA